MKSPRSKPYLHCYFPSKFDHLPRKRLKFGLQGFFERDGGHYQYTGRKLTLSEANVPPGIPTSRRS